MFSSVVDMMVEVEEVVDDDEEEVAFTFELERAALSKSAGETEVTALF